MRSAPSVTYPAGRCAFFAGLLAVCAALGLIALIGVARWVPTERLAIGAMLWLTWVALAGVSWYRSPVGRLRWDALGKGDGESPRPAGSWSWHSTAYQDGVALLRVERVQDLQRWMLLRLHNPDGARTWVWVDGGSDPGRWNDLRRAVVACE